MLNKLRNRKICWFGTIIVVYSLINLFVLVVRIVMKLKVFQLMRFSLFVLNFIRINRNSKIDEGCWESFNLMKIKLEAYIIYTSSFTTCVFLCVYITTWFEIFWKECQLRKSTMLVIIESDTLIFQIMWNISCPLFRNLRLNL